MNNYTEELKRILKNSEKEAELLGNTNINTIHILLSTLKTNNSLKETFKKHKLDYNTIKKEIPTNKKEIKYTLYSKELFESIENVILSQTNIDDEITLHLLLNEILSNENTKCYKLLKELNIDIQSLKKDISSSLTLETNSILCTIGRNLNEQAQNNTFDPVIGRENEINKVIQVLKRKNKNNPLLIGEAGVGKTSIVEQIAKLITKEEVPTFLKNKTIYEISMSSLISGTKYRGEFEEKITKLIKELETHEDIILFIDEIHTLVGAGGAEGAIDASNILKPALARGKIKLIGATTIKEYKSTIEKDKALERRFNTILINEPTKEETLNILKKIKPNYEKYHNVKIPENIIKLTTELTDKYIKNKYNPDKTIDILDEISAYTTINKYNKTNIKLNDKIKTLKERKTNYLKENNIKEAYKLKKEINTLQTKLNNLENNTIPTVTTNTLKKVLENKTNSTILELTNKNFFIELKTKLKEKIYDQEKIIDEIINKLIKYKNNKVSSPLSITLEGPPKTGKTYLVKTLSKYLNINLITIQMKEYKDRISINKLIGSTPGYIGYNDQNSPLEALKYNPVSILLLEDYNYSSDNIKELINNSVKTGYITLNNNETIYINNTIIIKTITKEKQKSIGFIEKQTNRDTLTFNSLSQPSIKKDENLMNSNELIKNI